MRTKVKKYIDTKVDNKINKFDYSDDDPAVEELTDVETLLAGLQNSILWFVYKLFINYTQCNKYWKCLIPIKSQLCKSIIWCVFKNTQMLFSFSDIPDTCLTTKSADHSKAVLYGRRKQRSVKINLGRFWLSLLVWSLVTCSAISVRSYSQTLNHLQHKWPVQRWKGHQQPNSDIKSPLCLLQHKWLILIVTLIPIVT